MEELTLETWVSSTSEGCYLPFWGIWSSRKRHFSSYRRSFFFILALTLQLSQAAPAGNWIGSLMIHLFMNVTHRLRLDGRGQRTRLRRQGGVPKSRARRLRTSWVLRPKRQKTCFSVLPGRRHFYPGSQMSWRKHFLPGRTENPGTVPPSRTGFGHPRSIQFNSSYMT